MSKSHPQWLGRCLAALRHRSAGSKPRRRLHLLVETLENRITPATLNIGAGSLLYTAAVGEANQLRVSNVGGVLKFTETSGIAITLGAGAAGAGWTGSGTNTVSGPAGSASISGSILLQDRGDKLTIQGFPVANLTVNGGSGTDTLSRAGSFLAGGDNWVLNGAGSGIIGSVLSFSNMENLVGGAKADNFTVEKTGSLNGKIDGGAGENILDYSISTIPVTFSLGTHTAANTTDTIPFDNITTFVGSIEGDFLVAAGPAFWGINGSNQGSVLLQGTGNSLDGVSRFNFMDIENLQGGTGADHFRLAGGSLSGGINGGGGIGRNLLDYGTTPDGVSVNLSVGSATSVSGGVANIQDVTGGLGNDTLIGDDNGNALNGNTGVDILLAAGGSDTLNGSDGEDDYLDGGSGIDALTVFLVIDGNSFLTDDYFADSFSADTLADIEQATLLGTPASDFIRAREFSGTLTVLGGDGDDTVTGSKGSNKLSGGPGEDTLTGSGSNDTLLGGDGDDSLFGGGGSDTLNGETGNDFLKGGPDNDAYLFDTDIDQGIDKIDESAGGVDRISFFPTTTLAVNLNLGISAPQAVNANLKLTLSSVEQATGGSKDDVLIGNGGNNKLSGGDGNDVLVGLGGADTLEGQNGRDVLIGGWGADMLLGGSETDILIGGRTAFDANLTALQAVMAEWASANSYSVRISHLTGAAPGGLNGTFTLHGGAAATAFDDAISDTLNGGDFSDWFLARAGDTTDKSAAETLTTI